MCENQTLVKVPRKLTKSATLFPTVASDCANSIRVEDEGTYASVEILAPLVARLSELSMEAGGLNATQSKAEWLVSGRLACLAADRVA